MRVKFRSIIIATGLFSVFGIGTQLQVSKAFGFSYCTGQKCILEDVPYLNQYDNPDGEYDSYGGNTCQVTSLAMLLNYKYSRGNIPKRAKPKDFYSQRELAKSPEGIASILKEELGYAIWSRKGTREEIKGLIRSDRPVILNNYFTQGGHVVLITGFTERGFVFNDPAGLWSGYFGSGYGENGSGNGVIYSYNSLTDEVIGEDGDIWYASGDLKPINTGYGNSL